MKKTLQFLLGLLLLPTFVFAAYNDATLGTSVILSVNGTSLVVQGSSVLVQSITVGATTFSVEMAAGSLLKVVNSSRRGFEIPAVGSVLIDIQCSAGESSVFLSNPAGAADATAVVTVSSSVCDTINPTGGGGGGGGGGGSSAPSATPATPATPTVSPAAPATPSPAAQPSPVAQLVSPAFNRTLSVGMRHADVKALQQLLNSDTATQVSSSGAGSPGNETEYFGLATERAVKKFQEKNGLELVGIVGPKTRAALNALAGIPASTTPTLPTPSATPSPEVQAVSPVFNRALTIGNQQLLNSDSETQVSSSGAGSTGNETEHFGPATQKAVQKFQQKHGLAQPGDPGYGFVGPKTRAKLQELFGSSASLTPGDFTQSVATPGVSPAASQSQSVQQLLLQLQALQAQLNALQGQ